MFFTRLIFPGLVLVAAVDVGNSGNITIILPVFCWVRQNRPRIGCLMARAGLPPPHVIARHLIRKRPELSDAQVAAKSQLSTKKVKKLRRELA